jgi:hypothetical protein
VKAGSKHTARTRAIIATARTTKGTTIRSRTLPPDKIKHGRQWSYGHHGCRCVPCRDANTNYCREQRERRALTNNNNNKEAS